MTTAMMEELLTVEEVARILKMSEGTVKRLLREKKLPGYKVSGSWRVSRGDLEQYLGEQRNIRDKQ